MAFADIKSLTREQFAKLVAETNFRGWNPKGIVLHNTYLPTLAQWAESGPKHAARMKGLESFYEHKGWNGGPHLFVSRTRINILNPLSKRGTHSPSWNQTHLGIEMVGDFSKEQFNSGDGALVRDNAVFAMAVFCKRFGWDIAKVLKFHGEDPRTTHKGCPGKYVVKKDIIARVKAAMEGE